MIAVWAGGMPEMVFEYILKKNGIDPMNDLSIDQSIDFGSTAAAFSGGQGEFTVEYGGLPHLSFINFPKVEFLHFFWQFVKSQTKKP